MRNTTSICQILSSKYEGIEKGVVFALSYINVYIHIHIAYIYIIEMKDTVCVFPDTDFIYTCLLQK